MSDSPYIPSHPLPPPHDPLSKELNVLRKSSRIAAQRKEMRSSDLCSTGSAAKNELLRRTSRSKASSKRSASISSNHRIPTIAGMHDGPALTEDNLLTHTSLTNSPQTRGIGQAQSIQFGKEIPDDETESSLSLDSENIRYYTEKLRRKRAHKAEITNTIYAVPTPLLNSDADNLTTPHLIEKVDKCNPGWQGVESALSGLPNELLRSDHVPSHMFDPTIPHESPINWPLATTTPEGAYDNFIREAEEADKGNMPHQILPSSPKTPPTNKFINLDLERTPRSPAVVRADANMIHALKGSDKDINPFHTTEEQRNEEFETSVVLSKVTTDHIINSGFQRPTTPTPEGPKREPLTFDEITHIRELWSELATYYAMLRPELITNSHALAEPAYAFIRGYQESTWCDVTVGNNTAREFYASKPSTNIPPPSNSMDTREDPVTTPKPVPTQSPPTSIPITEWAATPVPIDPVPAPIPGPTIPNSDFPTLNVAHRKLLKSPIKIGKPKPFANIAKAAPIPKISPPILPKSSILSKIDALGTQALNNKTPVAAAPTVPRSAAPPPSSNKPAPKGKMSYAQVTTNTAQNMPFTQESIKVITSLDPSIPADLKESIIRGLPRLPPPKPSPKPISPKAVPTPKTVAISKGPSRKSAIFALDGTLHATMLEDPESIVSGMNVYLSNTISEVRVETGRVTNSSLHLNLNLVPNFSNFQYIRQALIQVLCLHDIPEDALIPYSPQSEAHLIIKGLDYYVTPYSTRPEDILTGTQVIEKMALNSRLDGLTAVRTPRVIKSKGSNDMAVVFLDVWDSQNGTNTKDIVNKMYHINGKLIRIEYARPREFVPQCQKCWAWTHGTKACRLNHHRCPKCNGGHKLENHNMFAECCAGDRDKNKGIISGCMHDSHCRNCGDKHAANDFGCIFNLNKHNRKWHSDRIAENKLKRDANIKAAFNPASPPVPSA